MSEIAEQIIYLMQSDKSEDAPLDSLTWSKNLFRTRAKESTGVVEVIARLISSIGDGQLAAGERSAGAVKESQKLYKANDISVDVRIREVDGSFTVTGQVIGNTDTEIKATLGLYESQTDEFGTFTFRNMAQGLYDLSLVSNEMKIKIENVDVN